MSPLGSGKGAEEAAAGQESPFLRKTAKITAVGVTEGQSSEKLCCPPPRAQEAGCAQDEEHAWSEPTLLSAVCPAVL